MFLILFNVLFEDVSLAASVLITYTHSLILYGFLFIYFFFFVQYYNHLIVIVSPCVCVLFSQTGTNIQEHLDSITASTQPYLLALGRKKKEVHQFFVILDKNVISCRSTSSLGAFDELFKVHYVFATTYNPMLYNMFTFIQTTVYNIDVGKVKESPRVAEVRARLLR